MKSCRPTLACSRATADCVSGWSSARDRPTEAVASAHRQTTSRMRTRTNANPARTTANSGPHTTLAYRPSSTGFHALSTMIISTAPTPHATTKSAARRLWTDSRRAKNTSHAQPIRTPAPAENPCKARRLTLAGIQGSTGGPEKNGRNTPTTDRNPRRVTQNASPMCANCARATTSHGSSVSTARPAASAADSVVRHPARNTTSTALTWATTAKTAKYCVYTAKTVTAAYAAQRTRAGRSTARHSNSVDANTSVVARAYMRASRALSTSAGVSAQTSAVMIPPRSPAMRRPRAAPSGIAPAPAITGTRRRAAGADDTTATRWSSRYASGGAESDRTASSISPTGRWTTTAVNASSRHSGWWPRNSNRPARPAIVIRDTRAA